MKYQLILALSVGFWSSLAVAAGEQVKLRADMWCPYNCSPTDKDRPGFLVEVAQAAFKDYQVDYQLQPWSRALHDAERGVIDGVIGASEGELKDGLYPKKALGMQRTCVYTSAKSSLVYSSAKDLEKSKVAVILDYVYADAINDFIKTHKSNIDAIGGDNALELNIKKVEAGRADALVEDQNVMNFQMQKLGKNLRLAGCEKPNGLYLAFGSKGPKSKKLLEILDQWTIKAEKSGELSALKKKYSMAD